MSANYISKYGNKLFMKTFTALILKEGRMFVAKCPEVGTCSQGSTSKKALANLKEATELYLEEFPEKALSETILTTFKVADSVKA